MVIGAALAAGGLSGCIYSDAPVFPSGALVAQTPIAQGWYVKQDYYDRDGERKISTGLQGTYIRLNGKVYDYYEETGKVERRFEMYASSPKETVFTAQSKFGESKWGYQRIDVVENRSVLVATEARCNEMDNTARSALQELGKLGPLKDGSCRVTDAVSASAAVLMGGNFPRAKISSYVRIPDDQIFTADTVKNGPKTYVSCKKEGPPLSQSFSSAHGLQGDGDGVRRHNVATTRTQETSLQFSFAVEAEGDKLKPWGYIALVYEETSKQYCKPMQMISIERWMPENAQDVEGANPAKVRAKCAQMDTQSCGSMAQMAGRYRGRVLAQGREVYMFPGTGLAYGQLLTVIGTPGFGPLTLLRTDRDGTTYAVMERG